jgi:hypothetical protein
MCRPASRSALCDLCVSVVNPFAPVLLRSERGEYFTAEEARAFMAQRKEAWLAGHKKG